MSGVNATTCDPARVLLVDDENLVRVALASLLGLQEEIDVVAQAASAREAIAMMRAHAVDVALIDVHLPDIDGLHLAEELMRDYPDLACIALTSHSKQGYLRRALDIGVQGFLPKTTSIEVLVEAIQAVRAGGRYVDPRLGADVIAARRSPLSERETAVLAGAAQGLSVSEIARGVGLSQGTVRNYLSEAMAKLKVKNRQEAIRTARDHGWIPEEYPTGS